MRGADAGADEPGLGAVAFYEVRGGPPVLLNAAPLRTPAAGVCPVAPRRLLRRALSAARPSSESRNPSLH